ncbi:hypothetical protein ACFX2G_016138 [Malus domestica]
MTNDVARVSSKKLSKSSHSSAYSAPTSTTHHHPWCNSTTAMILQILQITSLFCFLISMGRSSKDLTTDFISDIRAGGIMWLAGLKHPHVSDVSLSFLYSSASE